MKFAAPVQPTLRNSTIPVVPPIDEPPKLPEPPAEVVPVPNVVLFE